MSGTRRILCAAAILVIIALALRFGMAAVDAFFRERVSAAIALARSEVEEKLGLSISFESLSPSILRSIAINDMVLWDHGGRAFLSAKTVRVYYDLFAILRGEPYNALKTIELQNATADVQLPRDMALLQTLATYVFPPPGSPMPRFKIIGRSLILKINKDGLGLLSLSAREFNYSSVGQTIDISFAGSYGVRAEAGAVGEVDGPLDVSGSLAKDLSMARMEIAVAGRSADFDFSTQRFELVFSGGVADLRKVRDMAPLDAALSFDLHDMSLAASLRLDGFVPQRSIRFHGALSAISPWLQMPYTGSITFNIPFGMVDHARYSIRLGTVLPASGEAQGGVRAGLSADGDLQRAQIAYLRLGNGKGMVEYRGSFDFGDLSPDGTIDAAVSLANGGLPISATVRVYGHAGIYTAFADRVEAAGVEFRDLSITAARKAGTIEFQASLRPTEGELGVSLPAAPRFSGEGGAEAGGLPLLAIEGSANLASPPTIDLSASLENIDLYPLRPLMQALIGSSEATAFLGSLKLGGEIFVTSDFSRVSWSVSDLAVVSRSAPGAYALLSLGGNGQSLSVRHLLVAAAGYTLEGTGSVDFAQAGRLGFEASLGLQNIPYELHGAVVGGSVFISGDYGLRLTTHEEGRETFFSASARELPVPIAGGVALATLDSDGRFVSAGDWNVAVSRFDLAPADEKTSALPRITLAGSLGPSGGRFPDLRLEDAYSQLMGSAEVKYGGGAGSGISVTATLVAAAHPSTPTSALENSGRRSPLLPGSGAAAVGEQYALALTYANGRLEGTLGLRASPLARLGLQGLGGSLDGHLSLHGTLSDPTLEADATLRDGTLGGLPLSLSLTGSYAERQLRIASIRARYQGNEIRSGSASYSLDDASLALSLLLAGKMGGRDMTMRIDANGARQDESGGGADVGTAGSGGGIGSSDSTGAAGSAPPTLVATAYKNLPRAFQRYSLRGALSNISMGSVKVNRWQFAISVDAKGFEFDGGDGQVEATVGTDGRFMAVARSPFPVVFTAAGTVTDSSLDARLDDLTIDLAALSAALPIAPVNFEEGRIHGSLAFKGPVGDPEITGSLGLESAVVSAPDWLSSKLGPFSAPLVAAGKSLALDASDVPVGKARLFLRATADIDHWVPANLKATIRTGTDAPLGLNLSIKGFEIKGDALFDLSAELRGDILALTGMVSLQRASVVISPQAFGGGDGSGTPFPYPLLIQAQLRFGRGVEVFFPSRDLPVVSGYADPSSVLNFRYDQTVEDLSVKGSLALRGGEVFYIQRSFFIRSASIQFNETLDHFDPLVTLFAELRDRNDQGSVLITLRTDKQPISKFRPTLASDPPMSEADIASLLGTGLFDVSSDETIDIRKAIISSSEFLPPLNVAKVFEQRVRDSLGLDVFSLNTQFLQQWLIDVSDPTQTATSEPLARYLNQTALYVGKYLGDSVFVHGEARFQRDPLVSGEPLRIDSEFGIEFDTPFGLVQWAITPTHPDSLYISDQSLSLTWRLSY